MSTLHLFKALVASAAVTGALAAPAAAVTAPIADLPAGQNLGVGLAGISWDYAQERWSLGAELRNTSPFPGPGSRFLTGVRGVAKLVELADLRIAALGGVQLDPGVVGGRSYLLPDLGIGLAYHFRPWGAPFTLRLNVTLTVDQGQGGTVPVYYGGSEYPVAPTGTWLQRLTLGPNTTVSLGFAPHDRYEVVFGGGTLIGLRVRY